MYCTYVGIRSEILRLLLRYFCFHYIQCYSLCSNTGVVINFAPSYFISPTIVGTSFFNPW